jgi:cystathionine gamma-synthase
MLTVDLPRLGFATSLADTTDAALRRGRDPPDTRDSPRDGVEPDLRVADIDRDRRTRPTDPAVSSTTRSRRRGRSARFDHGADVVVHSVTRCSPATPTSPSASPSPGPRTNDAMREAAVTWGLTPSPFDCWLAERGLHTFELRYDRAEVDGRALADALAECPAWRRCSIPGARSSRPRAGQSLFGGRGGTMVSIRLDGGGTAPTPIRPCRRPDPVRSRRWETCPR